MTPISSHLALLIPGEAGCRRTEAQEDATTPLSRQAIRGSCTRTKSGCAPQGTGRPQSLSPKLFPRLPENRSGDGWAAWRAPGRFSATS